MNTAFVCLIDKDEECAKNIDNIPYSFSNSLNESEITSNAFKKVANKVSATLTKYKKQNKTVCLMCSDPDNLGAALCAYFFLKN